MKILPTALVALTLASAIAGAAIAGQDQVIKVGGQARSFYVHVPDRLPKGAPLVFMLHGAGGHGRQAAENYGWIAKADQAKFVLVAPDAAPVFAGRDANFLTNPRVWNDGSGRAGENVTSSDDIGLIRALIVEMERRHGIDRARVYVSGFSSGSSMTQRIGVEMSGEIAAIAPGAGELMQKNATVRRALPVLYFVGDADPLAPYQGGEVRYPWGGRPQIREAARLQTAHWARINGCATPPGEQRIGANVRLTRWIKCRDGVEVAFYTIEGLGHHWPGSARNSSYERIAGPYVESFRAVDLIWDFFSRFRLK